GVVGILDTAFRCRDIFADVLQVGDGVFEAVLHRTELGALGVDLLDGIVDYQHSGLRTRGVADIDALNVVSIVCFIYWISLCGNRSKSYAWIIATCDKCTNADQGISCRTSIGGPSFGNDLPFSVGILLYTNAQVSVIDCSSNKIGRASCRERVCNEVVPV